MNNISKCSLIILLAMLFYPAQSIAQVSCPEPVKKDSLIVTVTGLNKSGGTLKVGYSVQNDFNVPMDINIYNWGRDVSRAFDSNGYEWTVDKSASRMDRWANTTNLPTEPGMKKSGNVIFSRIDGDVSSDEFDFTLNFSALPSGTPGSGLGKTRMVSARIRGVVVDCEA
jgi:hypothetical protein